LENKWTLLDVLQLDLDCRLPEHKMEGILYGLVWMKNCK